MVVRTIGVEEELLVVDLSAGYPTPRFDELTFGDEHAYRRTIDELIGTDAEYRYNVVLAVRASDPAV